MVPSPDPAQLTPVISARARSPSARESACRTRSPPPLWIPTYTPPKSIRTALPNAASSSRHPTELAFPSTETLVILSGSCAVRGFLSIIASIYIWLRAQFPLQEATPDAVISIAVAARAERSAIFVGLWAPSFFALAAFLRSVANGSPASVTLF